MLPNLISSKRTTDDQEELLIKSPWALKFYLVDGKQSPLTEEGFMPTGDIGEFKDMKLSIVGRIKDLIIRGGINISPFSIENCIQSCDLVEEVAVVGVPHEFWGEQIISCIVLKNLDDKDSALKDIKDIVNARIAENMKPDKYLIMDTLPKNSNGKNTKKCFGRQYKMILGFAHLVIDTDTLDELSNFYSSKGYVKTSIFNEVKNVPAKNLFAQTIKTSMILS